TAEHPRAAKRDAGAARAIRVAVAGATGYTGQELLRLLSRHPGVTITAATSSGATAARKLPALGHLFKGEITPLDPASLAQDADVVFVAKPGVAGAGKTPSERTHFSEVHGSVAAYGVFGHRHGAEIEQGVGGQVNFVPHLVPLDRGILSTIYAGVAPGTSEDSLASVYERTYAREPFIRLVGSALPEIKHVTHTNFCDIGWRVDPSGRAVVVSVIDNLLKGASGQA